MPNLFTVKRLVLSDLNFMSKLEAFYVVASSSDNQIKCSIDW